MLGQEGDWYWWNASQVLGPGLCFLLQKRHAHTIPNPQKGHGGDLGGETPLIQGMSETSWTDESWEEKAQGDIGI